MEWNFSPATPQLPPPEDEVIKGPWGYHVLQMANKFYRPSRLSYYTRHGDDQRIKHMAYFLDVRGQRVLEIGPYEGHHSVILEKMGVRELVLVESRDDNVAKCRRVIEKYNLDHTTIIQQDIERIYDEKEPAKFSGPFDLTFCAGVLYHLPNPAKALQWLHTMGKQLFLATQILDPKHPHAAKFPRMILEHEGKKYRGGAYREGGVSDAISGMSPVSFWSTEEDLVRMIADAGYKNISVLGKDIQNGSPHITILAED